MRSSITRCRMRGCDVVRKKKDYMDAAEAAIDYLIMNTTQAADERRAREKGIQSRDRQRSVGQPGARS